MFIIRPASPEDLDALVALARVAGVGLTTLPADRRLLAARVQESQHALKVDVIRPAGESYLLVLEDVLSGQIVGTAGMVARVGGFEPFYSYRLEGSVHACPQLGVFKTIRRLHLVADHKGPSEIGTLFVHPNARGGGNGRLLSLSRFLFMAAFRDRFADQVIAEMRGVSDADGVAPFWDAVGRHFFDMDFGEADCQSAGDKQFIADLMPHHPIYIPLLPPEVQAIIGEVHDDARGALKLLKQEGFCFGEQVDIFDAGPLYRAPIDQVRTIRDSQVAPLQGVVAALEDGPQMLIGNERLEFRACLGHVSPVDGGVTVTRAVALSLGLHLGDPVRYVPARPS